MHGPLKKSYLLHTNFKDVANQVCLILNTYHIVLFDKGCNVADFKCRSCISGCHCDPTTNWWSRWATPPGQWIIHRRWRHRIRTSRAWWTTCLGLGKVPGHLIWHTQQEIHYRFCIFPILHSLQQIPQWIFGGIFIAISRWKTSSISKW